MDVAGIVISIVAFALALGVVAGMITFNKAVMKHVFHFHSKPSKNRLNLNYRMK